MNKPYYLYKPYTLKASFLLSLLIAFLIRFFAGCTVSPKDHPEQMEAIFKIVNALPENNIKQIQALDSGFYLIKDAGIDDKLRFYGLKGNLYSTAKDYIKTMKYVDSAMVLIEKRIDNPKYAVTYAKCLASKGDIYLALKKYDESFACYTKARETISTKAPDSCHSPGYMYRMGNILYIQEKYRSAAAYYKSADQEDTCLGNGFERFVYHQLYLDNIGMCYSKVNMWDSAMYFYDSTLKYIGENETRFPVKQDYIKYIRKDAIDPLENIVQLMKDNPTWKLEISSHTDSRGSDSYNMKLSQRRAKAAMDYLIAHGIDAGRLTANGYGETRLVNNCSNGVECSEKTHQLNRRSEFNIAGQ